MDIWRYPAALTFKNRAPAIAKVLNGEDIGPPTMDVNLMRKGHRADDRRGQVARPQLPVTSRHSTCSTTPPRRMGEVDADQDAALLVSRPKPVGFGANASA